MAVPVVQMMPCRPAYQAFGGTYTPVVQQPPPLPAHRASVCMPVAGRPTLPPPPPLLCPPASPFGLLPTFGPVRMLPFHPSPAPAMVPVVPPPASAPPAVDVEPWLRAARSFTMNTEFDVSHAVNGRTLDLPGVMAVMKEESAGKRTIQALGDKLMLHRLLANLGIPQMPALLTIEGHLDEEADEIGRFVREHLCGESEDGDECSGSEEVIVKPTHLSNATGVLVLSQPKPEEVDSAIQYIQAHVRQYMSQQAGLHESVALRSLRPSFIGQPRYQSVVGFRTPLELRVVVLWGKARLAVWWWGRGAAPGECPHRNAWLVRRPPEEGELSDDDDWEVIHEHRGKNPGFDKALELFQRHISSAASMAQVVATAVGAPFLRVDFFVGSPKWGLRLNEVAYGCGMEYRNRLETDGGAGQIIDDAPAIAQILQAGMALCRKRPPHYFLNKLGARGSTYEEMTVVPRVRRRRRRRYLAGGCDRGEDEEEQSPLDCAVPDELCRTFPSVPESGLRSQSFRSELAGVPLPWRCPAAPGHRSFSFDLARVAAAPRL